jgi:hypothetical protein
MGAPRQRRALGWLVGALALLLVATWLFGHEDPPPAPPAPTVSFPRGLDSEGRQRMERRRSLVVAPAVTADAGAAPVAVDPVMAVLPPRGAGRMAVVVEASALLHGSLGQAFMECLTPSDDASLEALQRATGVDLLRDLDRVAATDDDLLVASGQLGALDPSAVLPGFTRESLGGDATLWTPSEGQGQPSFVRWKDELVLMGRDRAQLEAAVARLERAGRGLEAEPPMLGEGDSYGEIYGVLGPDVFADLVPPELAQRLAEVAQRIELHVSAQDDLGIVLEVDGEDRERLGELARMAGGALALGRLEAQAGSDRELAELLDLARVQDQGSRLALELAVPRAWLEERVLSRCREKARAARSDAGVAP